MTKYQKKSGFSLVELMVVVAILSILLALSAVFTKGTAASFELSTTTGQILDIYNRAREQSITLNESVQVRIYKQDDVYTGISTGVIDPDTLKFKRLTGDYFIPESVTFLEDEYSTIITGDSSLSQDDLTITEGVEDIDGETVDFSAVTFAPNNRIRLSNNTLWTLTIVQQPIPSGSTGLPDNFAVIQLNPNTARGTVTQPN